MGYIFKASDLSLAILRQLDVANSVTPGNFFLDQNRFLEYATHRLNWMNSKFR